MRLTIKELNAETARKNRAFARMTPSQKRVAIARDVLDQLRARRIIAEAGTYLRSKNEVRVRERHEGRDLSELTKQIKSCNACAIGSMFLCAVERADKLKVGGAEDDSAVSRDPTYPTFNGTNIDWHRYLAKFFSDEQLQAIEGAFERGEVGGEACEMLRVVDDDGDRLRLIMENLSRNRGRFVSDDPRMFSGEID